MGGTRLAFHAGITAARMVTIIPTSSPAMIERGAICSVVDGSDAPAALKAARRMAANAMPKMMPMIEATRPVITASSRTVRTTWPPEAPTARRRPIWRVRWATVILKALKMTNEPTNRAMRAKPIRKLRKMSTNCLNWSLASAAAFSPVMAS